MKNRMRQLVRTLLLTGAIAFIVPQAAMALTAACTQINNRAYVDYKIGGASQTQIGSTDGSGNNNTSFYVGVKVDVLVENNETLQPYTFSNASSAKVTFKVTNNGNATMGYGLTSANTAVTTTNPFGGINDTFNVITPILSTNGTAGASGSIASIAAAAFTTVDVWVKIPAGLTASDVTVLSLIAQSKLFGSGDDVTAKNINTKTGADIGGTVCTANGIVSAAIIDIVSADGDGDGTGADDAVNDGKKIGYDSLGITVGGLTITKTQAVYWDPVNGTGSFGPPAITPKAIPGAVVTYTVTIANAGSSPNATAISVGDDLSAMISATNIVFGNGQTGATNTSYNDGTTSCISSGVGYGILVGGVCKSNVFLGNDGGSFNDAADTSCGGTNKVCASGISVNAGASTTVKYQVTIQ